MGGGSSPMRSEQILGKWENAYAEQMHDAALGRLFRGIIHNLNGVLQAFSMQAELFELMFRQADASFSQIFSGTEIEKKEALENLFQLLKQRATLAEQMNEKVLSCQKIVQRTLSLRAHPAPAADSAHYPLSDLIEEEIGFLCADSFFKHEVAKEVELGKDLTILQKDLFHLRLAIQEVLLNALESLKPETKKPTVRVAARRSGKGVVLEITDNGQGLSEEARRRMFSPFFSTKEGHAGLGLYMALNSLASLGGDITATAHDGKTSFVLQFCLV